MAKDTMQDNHYFFVKNLLQWHSGHHRPMPWKGERNPYLIWLSEIILQQTRVEQGLPYFERFKAAYPTVVDLAKAPEDEVMKLWEGLGYYARARNLHATAKHIADALNGSFPIHYEGIRSLKGVGEYTAAAVASFAYDLPYVVVDGNVYRVLSRFLGIETPIDSTEGKKQFAKLAQQLLELGIADKIKAAFAVEHPTIKCTPSGFNQAIMDFGATHCTPATPKCASCPLQPHCEAFKSAKTGLLPVKSKKLERRDRYFNYLIINRLNEVFVKKRGGKDIWQHLYEFPLIETEKLVESRSHLAKIEAVQAWLGKMDWVIKVVSPPMRQELTHQRIVATFWEIEIEDNFLPKVADWMPIERKNLTIFAFPKVIDLYIRQKSLPLELF